MLTDTSTPDLDGQPAAEIDKHLHNWYDDIARARDANIPKTTHRTLPHHKNSHTLNLLKIQYKAVYDLANLRGWDRTLRERVRDIRVELQEANKQLHKQHWETLTNELCNNQHDPKQFWSSYKRLMGSNRRQCTHIYNQHREKVDTTEEMEAVHREYWTQNFHISNAENTHFDQDTEVQVNEENNRQLHLLTPSHTINLNTLNEDNPLTAHITPREITETITRTKNKAPGPSQINKTIMQNLPPNMITRLTHISNASLASGRFPSLFKHATLTLIPKPNKSIHEVTSYRPISLLEVPGKILERIISKRLTNHLEHNDLQNPRQYGFRPHRGTEPAIALAYEEIALSLANKRQTTIILRDVSKAFDKVWHEGLRFKLLNLNLPHNLTQILSNFLEGRSASIKLGSYTGPPIPLRSGVPQGSIISPTLYIYYTADLPPPTPYSNYIAYADDITQIISHPTKSKNIMKLATERAITNINTFEKRWKIQTNMTKFHIIPAARMNPPLITINNNDIPYTNTGKMLGMAMNRHGTSTHTRDRINKARHALTKLKRFSSCTTKTKIRLCKTTVRPILEYTPIPLVTASKTLQTRMQTLQNKALRWAGNITYPNTITSEQLHNIYNIEPINIRIHRRAQTTWEKLKDSEDQLHENIWNTHTNTQTNHGWWPRTLPVTEAEPPAPRYNTRQPHVDDPGEDTDDEN